MTLRTLMKHVAATIRSRTPVARAREVMEVLRAEHLIVADARRVVGVLSAGDLPGPEHARAEVGAIADRHVLFAEPDEAIEMAARRAVACCARVLVVMDGGCPVGLVAADALLRVAERPSVRARARAAAAGA